MFRFFLLMVILLVSASAFAEIKMLLQLEKIIQHNKDWRPKLIEVRDEIFNENGKREYLMLASGERADGDYSVKEVIKDGEKQSVDNKDARKLIYNEIAFIRDIYAGEADIERVTYAGRGECGTEICDEYHFIISGQLDVKVKMLSRAYDKLPLEWEMRAMKPFKKDGAYVTEYYRRVTFNPEKDQWYPVSKYEEAEFEIKKYMYTWRGKNVTTSELSGYEKKN